ncbi:hypothetical protein [Amycolatopsis sacchari]|uniref:Immunity protein Imm1 n=1 Tax=Amycolatopsis sacchari TaxID=115433 RepID=A0A1I4B7Z6_9PSEU|nr:hypothetical protein [Amycolatopsis sacchari]SFK64257.1 hypothetical protein SAMN05421835_1272 [Amycolatopsis sacchari]
MQLSVDTWDGVHVSFVEIGEPTLEQVLEAVDQLDSKIHTEVSVRRDEPFEYLTIAGGPEYFLVSGEGRDGSFPQLTTPDAGEGKVTLVVGGQSSEFNLTDVVRRDRIPGAVQQLFDGLTEDLPAPWVVE